MLTALPATSQRLAAAGNPIPSAARSSLGRLPEDRDELTPAVASGHRDEIYLMPGPVDDGHLPVGRASFQLLDRLIRQQQSRLRNIQSSSASAVLFGSGSWRAALSATRACGS